MKHKTISHNFEITGATSNRKYFHSWDFIQFKMKIKNLTGFFFLD